MENLPSEKRNECVLILKKQWLQEALTTACLYLKGGYHDLYAIARLGGRGGKLG